jgi:hypothetical protein
VTGLIYDDSAENGILNENYNTYNKKNVKEFFLNYIKFSNGCVISYTPYVNKYHFLENDSV